MPRTEYGNESRRLLTENSPCTGQMPAITVAVVTYNSRGLLPELLASLPAAFSWIETQDGPQQHIPWRLVVADNNSADETVTELRAIAPYAQIVEMGRNAGYAAGINAAVTAGGPHSAVLVLNPDVRLHPGCIPELVRALNQRGVGIAVPRLHDGQDDLILSMRREPSILRTFADAFFGARRAGRLRATGEIVSDPMMYEKEMLTDWAEGSTQLISASCWAACGPWDERYFLYSEETDFDLRARDAGFATRFVPTAYATHLKGDSATSPPLWALLTINRVKLHKRRTGTIRASAFWTAMVLREGSRALLGRSTNRAALRALLSIARLRGTPGPDWVA
jgi:N-acetylglucosaminyl-diphospho-decaprenol L-rhamnosyltransferase